MLTSSLEERTGYIKVVRVSSTGPGEANLNNEILGDKS